MKTEDWRPTNSKFETLNESLRELCKSVENDDLDLVDDELLAEIMIHLDNTSDLINYYLTLKQHRKYA